MLNPFTRPQSFAGVPVTVSAAATEIVPIFPDKRPTKRRRRRVVGKFGSWTRRAPCVFRHEGGLIVHPKIYAELRSRSAGECASLL